MNGRRRSTAISSNPVLIGAVTTLVLVVAVFLAYNANSGLPFVPTYELRVEIPDAGQLVVGNDVRIGGHRVGVVSGIAAHRTPTGRADAVVEMKLEKSVEPLPLDTTVIVRPRSALGLKFVELTPGRSQQGYTDGGLIPLKQATPEPVEIDQLFNTFDEATRAAQRKILDGFGSGLAGRGQDLNLAIQDLPALLRDLQPVMRTLADPRTRLVRFFQEAGRAASIVGPVGARQADLFANLDATFRALATVARPSIQESISEGPATLDALTRDLPATRPFLANSAALFRELAPGVRALKSSAPLLADAIEFGTPVLRRSVALSRRLRPTLRSLQRFAEDPQVALGVNNLTELSSTLRPTVAFLKPAQTVCNYATLWFRNVASLLSEGDANGTWQRFIIVATPVGPNSESTASSAPANGPTLENHLHVNSYPNTASGDQPTECEAANEPYAAGQTVIGNVPGNQGTTHDETKSDVSGAR